MLKKRKNKAWYLKRYWLRIPQTDKCYRSTAAHTESTTNTKWNK